MNKKELLNWLQKYPFVEYQKPLVMGVINLTPDSFFDGNRFLLNDAKALDHAKNMLASGVDIIDIGGESTKPGAKYISEDEELRRVIPFIEKIRAIDQDICISIDTYKPEVMHAAINSGATLINDISGLTHDNALEMAKKLEVPIILMHMQGNPEFMQDRPFYKDIVTEINSFFTDRVAACIKAGIARHNIILDPGFGFGKTVQHNLSLVRDLQKFKKHKLPILLGVSRKSTLGSILNKKPADLLIGSLAMAAFAIMQGVSIIRVHDVDETKQVVTILDSMNSRSDINE